MQASRANCISQFIIFLDCLFRPDLFRSSSSPSPTAEIIHHSGSVSNYFHLIEKQKHKTEKEKGVRLRGWPVYAWFHWLRHLAVAESEKSRAFSGDAHDFRKQTERF